VTQTKKPPANPARFRGARKIWQRGISGQSRLIYYYHIGDGEVFFLTCYPKNRKRDLSEGEKEALRETIKTIKALKREKAGERR
jgi:hypothetical protein